MYLGIAIGLPGFALLFSSAWDFAFPALFAGLTERFFIRHEEQVLERQFGAEYEAYRAKVRRWI